MNKKTKPTLEEMFEAYRRMSGRIEDMSRRSEMPQLALPVAPARGWKSLSLPLRTTGVAAAIALLIIVALPSAHGYAMNGNADRAACVEAINQMLSN